MMTRQQRSPDIRLFFMFTVVCVAVFLPLVATFNSHTDDCDCYCPCNPWTYCDCQGVCHKRNGSDDPPSTTPTTTRTTTTPTPSTTTTTPTTTTTTPTTTTTTPTTTTTTPTTTTTTPTTTTTTPTTTTTTPTTTTTTPTTTTTTPTTTTTTPTTTTTTPTTTTTTPSTTTTPFSECTRAMDLVIAIDTSNLVTSSAFDNAKAQMLALLDYFPAIERDGTHVAFYTFDNKPKRISNLNMHYAAATLKGKIANNAVYRGTSTTKIIPLLNKLVDTVLTTDKGMRGSAVPKTTIILTHRSVETDRGSLFRLAASLKVKSTVFVVGMGPNLNDFIMQILPTSVVRMLFALEGSGLAQAISPRELAFAVCNDDLTAG